MSVTAEKKQEIIKDNAQGSNDTGVSAQNLDQRDRRVAVQREILAIVSSMSGQHPPLAERSCLTGREG